MIKHIEKWSMAAYDPVPMREITAAIIYSNGQYIHYNLPKPRDYTQEDTELLSRFDDLFKRSQVF